MSVFSPIRCHHLDQSSFIIHHLYFILPVAWLGILVLLGDVVPLSFTIIQSLFLAAWFLILFVVLWSLSVLTPAEGWITWVCEGEAVCSVSGCVIDKWNI